MTTTCITVFTENLGYAGNLLFNFLNHLEAHSFSADVDKIYKSNFKPDTIRYFSPSDGTMTYGELHITWNDDSVFQQWLNDPAIQLLRQHEFSFIEYLSSQGVQFTRYLPYNIGSEPNSQPMQNFVVSGYSFDSVTI